ncbi:hypothetical protein Vi05172_g2209 [Venturia inaequalis]|nr:hypothetical protein Vi05172_g2209 [Venturia inaequalis]
MDVGKWNGGTRLTAALEAIKRYDKRIVFNPKENDPCLDVFGKRSMDRPGLLDSRRPGGAFVSRYDGGSC